MKFTLTFFCISLLAISCNSQESTTHDLIGSRWLLTQISSEKVSPEMNAFIQLNNDGRVNGNAGCNNFFGDYALKGNTLTFGTMGATKMMCENMTVEDTFFQMLGNVASYNIQENELLLVKSEGTILAVFKIEE